MFSLLHRPLVLFVFHVVLSSGAGALALGSIAMHHAQADEVEEVLDFLIAERVAERSQSSDAGRPVTKELGQAKLAFPNIPGYEIGGVQHVEENGTVEMRATYYSLERGPTFNVRIILPVRFSGGTATELGNSLRSLERSYRDAFARHPLEIHGFPSAVLEVRESGNRRGVIVRLAPEVFVVAQANELLSTDSITSFLRKVPLHDVGVALGV